MTFEDYVKKPNFVEFIKDLKKRKKIGEVIIGLIGFPIFLVGGVCAIVAEFFPEESPVSNILFWVVLGCAFVGVSLFIFATFYTKGFSNLRFIKELFVAEELFAQEYLKEFCERIPKEGDITVWINYNGKNSAKLSLDGVSWTEIKLSVFQDVFNLWDLCATVCVGYFPRLEREMERGFFPNSFAFSLDFDFVKEKVENRVHCLIAKGKFTAGGKSAMKQWKKLKQDSPIVIT